jgi:hypothetical protein
MALQTPTQTIHAALELMDRRFLLMGQIVDAVGLPLQALKVQLHLWRQRSRDYWPVSSGQWIRDHLWGGRARHLGRSLT